MSTIPEGTQFIEAGCGEKGFRKFEKGCWWFFEGFWRHVDWKMGALTLVTEHPSYVAPATSWIGEGLPPAGTVCEFQHRNAPNGQWHPTTIRFSSHAFVVYVDSIREVEECWRVNDGCAIDFRPVRTAEQIAERDRKIAIGEMIDIFKASHGLAAQEGIAALYDAGYRKVTP